MWNNYGGMPWGQGGGFWLLAPVVAVVAVWTLYWKGRALWHAAHKEELYWFIALLVINTLGILEILYLYFFSKKTEHVHSEKRD